MLKVIEVSVDKGIEVVYKENLEKSLFKEEVYCYVIVVVGEYLYVEINGDSLNLIIFKFGLEIINNVCEYIKCVVVLILGCFVVIEFYLEKMDVFVVVWLLGLEG